MTRNMIPYRTLITLAAVVLGAVGCSDRSPLHSVDGPGRVANEPAPAGVSQLESKADLSGRTSDDMIRSNVKFIDIITSIDYKAGTFTVKNVEGTVATGDETSFVKVSESNGPAPGGNPLETPIDLTDLSVGQVVYVQATKAVGSVFSAQLIQLVDDSGNPAVHFRDVVLFIEPGSRTIIFKNSRWSGTVVKSAILLGPKDEELKLNEFTPGETIEVTSFRVGKSAVEIARMKTLGTN